MKESWNPLVDAIDLHIHTGPDIVKRYCDSISLAKEAAQKGMRGIVLKDQMVASTPKAILSNAVVPEIDVFGSVVLNYTSGGLNIRSVIANLKMGAKVVWFPTIDAKYSIEKCLAGHWLKNIAKNNTFGYSYEGIELLENGNCKKVVKEILKIVFDYNAIVATGHISPIECLCLIEANKNIGAKVVVTHPNLWFDDFSSEILKELVKGKATLEFTAATLAEGHGQVNPEEIVSAINNVGYLHCCLSTDYGGTDLGSPPEGFSSFAYTLHKFGLSKVGIDYMMKQKPKELLGLN